jgi:membrane-bound serine protease (ClpP class)
VLPLEGPIDKGMLYVFRRAFREVETGSPDAVIMSIDTPGGGLRETDEIVSWLRSLDVPTYAFVNPNALSAGAIISLACDAIFMAPGARIGSAMPVALSPLGGGVQQLPPDLQEKILSDVRSRVRNLAQENGYSEAVAEAMVDLKKELRIGERVLCPPGELLNLTAEEAIAIIPPQQTPLLARAIVDDVAALLLHEDLDGRRIVRFEEMAAERLARYITLIGPILLALGVLCLYIEFKTPGIGLPGAAGVVLLGIYFFGHYVAGLAGIEDLVLVLFGLVLLAVELFVIPGFGVVGFVGLLCMAAGIVMGLVPALPNDLPALPDVPPLSWAQFMQEALTRVVVAGIIGAFGVWLLGKILPKTPVYRDLVLGKSLSHDDGFVSGNAAHYATYIGHQGVAVTALRPAGIAMFGDERLDVVSSGDMIAADAAVRVITVEGARIVVEEVLPPSAAST